MNWLIFSFEVDIDSLLDSLKFAIWFGIIMNFVEYLLMIFTLVTEVIFHGIVNLGSFFFSYSLDFINFG